MTRFQKHYEHIVSYDLLFKDHFINVMQLPKLDHMTLNTGIGLKGILDRKQLLTALLGLEFISNQRAMITRAKKSIDKFKLREKMPLGCKVTLRKKHLYEFLDSLINTVLPVMDNSSDLYNSKYFKNYLLKRQKGKELEGAFHLPQSQTEGNEMEHTIKKNRLAHTKKNISINLNQMSFKWICNLFNLCSKDIRFKCWLSNSSGATQGGSSSFNKKFFIPKGKDYIFLNFTNAQKFFLQNHHFNFLFFSQKSQGNTAKDWLVPACDQRDDSARGKNVTKQKLRLKTFNYSVAFGLKDFISSTTFGNSCGPLESSHGLDIVFVIKLLKNKNLKKPQYFLSTFQMPF